MNKVPVNVNGECTLNINNSCVYQPSGGRRKRAPGEPLSKPVSGSERLRPDKEMTGMTAAPVKRRRGSPEATRPAVPSPCETRARGRTGATGLTPRPALSPPAPPARRSKTQLKRKKNKKLVRVSPGSLTLFILITTAARGPEEKSSFATRGRWKKDLANKQLKPV